MVSSVHGRPHLAVHDEVSDAAGEVLVLELWVDIWQILIHSSKLKHLSDVQMPESATEQVKFACLQFEMVMCCMLWRGNFSADLLN